MFNRFAGETVLLYLKRAWLGIDGKPEKGALYNENLQSLLRSVDQLVCVILLLHLFKAHQEFTLKLILSQIGQVVSMVFSNGWSCINYLNHCQFESYVFFDSIKLNIIEFKLYTKLNIELGCCDTERERMFDDNLLCFPNLVM